MLILVVAIDRDFNPRHRVLAVSVRSRELQRNGRSSSNLHHHYSFYFNGAPRRGSWLALTFRGIPVAFVPELGD